MKFRRISSFIAAMLLVCSLASCKKTGKEGDAAGKAAETTEAPTEEETEQPTTVPPDLFPDYPISYPEITTQETGDLYEAEYAVFNGELSISGEKKDVPQPATDRYGREVYIEVFSGEGYVTGFGEEGKKSVTFRVEAPSTQHYDLAFSISSEAAADCKVLVDGHELTTFTTIDDGEFTLITIYGVFLTEGSSEIELIPENGDIKLDYLRLKNNTTLGELKYSAGKDTVNKEAAESAKELKKFLTDNYGRYIISGQYCSDNTNKELDLIYENTGKYPVIRFSAMHNSGDSFDTAAKDIKACEDWHKKGGIVGLMWYWEAPGKTRSVYAEETDFRLSDAFTETDISGMSQEEIKALYTSGKIPEGCYALIQDLDSMAAQLLALKDKGIPVLWRPLHESSGDWFWWGSDGPDAYTWLWELMYKRYTGFFGLDNLIWIWNGQSDSYTVNKDTFDIASVDIYLDSKREFGSRFEQFAALQKIVGPDKLIALSECSCIPDADAAFRDNAVWSFFGLWYGKYIENNRGRLAKEYMDKDYLIHAYNSDGILTLDEYRTLLSGEKLTPEYGTEPSTEDSTADTTEETSGEEPAAEESNE